MTQYFTGDGTIYGDLLRAGEGALGSAILDGETLSLARLTAGRNFDNGYGGAAIAASFGDVRITNGSDITFEYQGAGIPAGGFYGNSQIGVSFTTAGVARGEVTVDGGSTVEFKNYTVDDGTGALLGGYNNLAIGRNIGGRGELTVEGTGTLVSATGGVARVNIGRDKGTGELNISDGATFGTFNLTVGRQGRGTIVVEGAGSALKLGGAYGFYGPNYAGADSYSSLGREFNGRAILAMFEGGVTEVANVDGQTDGPFLRFGRDVHSFGYGIASGTDSALNIIQSGPTDTGTGATLQVGAGGRGILALQQDAELNVLGDGASVRIASGRGGQTDPLESQLILRSGATGVVSSIDKSSGSPVATATSATISVGSFAGSYGKLIVDGTGTTLTISSDNTTDTGATPGTLNYGASLQVGDDGNGRLEVTNGGTITIDGTDDVFPGFIIGNGRDGSQATSYALVSGEGSSVSLNGTRAPGTPYSNIGEAAFIGVGHRDGKTGTLAIRDGGAVTNGSYNSSAQIGGNTGGTGTVIVDGATSSFSAGDILAIGADIDFLTPAFEFSNGGTGTLTLINGGVASAGTIGIGDTGTLNLAGALTGDVTVTGQINVGGEDAVTTGFLNGDVDALAGVIEFEAFDFQTGGVDRLSLSGQLSVDSDDLFVDLGDLGRASVGDSAVLLDISDVSNTDAPTAADFNILNTPGGVTAVVTDTGNQFTLSITGAPDKTVGFVGGDVSILEGDPGDNQSVILEIVRSGDLSTTMDIVVSVVVGTADLSDLEAGTPAAVPLSFGIGEDRVFLPAFIGEDNDFEGDETITAVITSAITGDASPVTILNDATTLTIVNDDLAPSAVLSGAAVAGSAGFATIGVDVNGSFLRLDPEDSPNNDATLVDLGAIGFSAGQSIFLRSEGNFDFTDLSDGNDEFGFGARAVFSATSTLLNSSYTNRVVDAIAPVGGFSDYTDPTPINGYATDIAEDFNLNDGVLQEIPVGANYLFLSTIDQFVSDNSDPNGDFRVNIFAPMLIGYGGQTGSATITNQDYASAALAVGFTGGQGDARFLQTRFDLSAGIEVGEAGGSGRLIIDQGSVFNVTDPGTYSAPTEPSVNIGTDGGMGYLAVRGGSTLTADSDFQSFPGGGYSGGYNNIVVGQNLGVGALTVEGEGSLVETVGTGNRLRVGFDNGDGELAIRDGGVVKTLTLTAGRRGGDGLVIISGEGSLLHLTNEGGVYGNPQYAGSGGFSTLGRENGSGSMFITDGGRVLAENADGVTDGVALRLGREYGSDGSVEIIGQGSGITIRQNGAIGDSYINTNPALYVGQGGQGEMTLRNGADVLIEGDSARLSVARGRDGLGASEASELQILSGSTVLVDASGYGANEATYDAGGTQIGTRNAGGRIHVAEGQNTNGLIRVDGAGSSMIVQTDIARAGDYSSGELRIGSLGDGQLTVSNGGYVGARELEVATGSFGLGSGVYGSGTVNILSGGTVNIQAPNNPDFLSDPDNLPNAYRGLRMATADGTTAEVNVDGAGSLLTVQGGAGRMDIGRRGEAHLNITNGGVAQGFFIEAGRDGRAYVSVDGAGSTLISENQFGYFGYGFQNEAGFIRFGRNYGGYGRLDVTNGGTVTAKNTDGTINDIPIIEFGRRTGSEGVFVVDGVGSSLNVTMTGSSTDGLQTGFYDGPQLRFGREGGEGHGTVRNGGVINIDGEGGRLQIGRGADGSGFTERSTLTIESGGQVNVSSIGNVHRSGVYVGDLVNARGRLTIDGAGSVLNVSSDNVSDTLPLGGRAFGANLTIGDEGTGDLIITNGGVANIYGNDDFFPSFQVGAGDGSVGTALISGAGSEVNIFGTGTASFYQAGIIDIGNGQNSSGILTIEQAAVVRNAPTNSITQIGEQSNSYGRVDVTTGAQFYAGDRIQLGNDLDFATNTTQFTGGRGILTIGNGSTVTANVQTDVGVNGEINLAGDLSTPQLLLEGTLNVGGAQSIGVGSSSALFTNATTTDIVFEFEDISGGEFDVLLLDPTQDPTDWGTPEVVLDMSGLGVVNVGDTATFLDWDGAAPDPALFVNTIFTVVNAPPGVTFNIGEDAVTGDWFAEVTNAPNGSVSIQGFAQTRDEGDPGDTTTYTYTVTRNGDLTQSVTVDFAVVGLGANAADGADFEGGVLPTGQVFFGTGATTATITLNLAEDADVEDDESFEVQLTGVSGNQVILNSSAVGVIRNDDVPATLSINSGISVLEDDFGVGGQTLDFTVTRTGDLVGDLDVDFVMDANGATSGANLNADLLANSDDLVLGAPQIGTVTIPDGQATATISIEIAADTIIEPREDLTVTLTGFSGDPSAFTFGNQVGVGTIINDDGTPPVIPVGLEADVFGDPHLVTLDGLGYDFQAVGEFVLVEDTSGLNPLSVQIRTAPVEGSDLVSIISAMAADMGQGVSLMLDVSQDPALLIDGVPTEVPATGANPVDAGDGQVFFDGEAYTIVFGTGDALKVAVFDDFMNVCVFLNPAVRAPGSVHGLLGDANGETANDFSLRDGSAIPSTEISFSDGPDGITGTGDDVPTLDFDFLYTTYADSWRISDAESLFHYSGAAGDEGTADYTDTDFPRGVLSVDALPQEILDAAIAAADAAGITDPILRESAILDFALTGDEQFAAGASGVAADPEVDTTPAEAPELPTTIGITPVTTEIVEGDTGSKTVSFTIYRIGDLTSALSVDYTIGGDVDAADFVGGTQLTGTVNFVQGEATRTVSVDVLGELASELDERIVASISTTATALIGAPSAITTVLTDDLAPIARGDGVFIVSGEGVTEISKARLLANDVDPDGDPVEIVPGFGSSANGAQLDATTLDVVTFIQGSIYAAESPDTVLADSFEYTATDGNGGLDTATVSLSVVVPNNGAFSGTAGADVMLGTTGNDTINGLDSDDEIVAGLGDDVLIGSAGGDTLDGGAGEDTADYSTSSDRVFVALNGDFATSGDATGDTLVEIEHLVGSDFADLLRGDGGANALSGGGAGDYLQGLGGDDTLLGGEGNDVLEGGAGADSLDGGDGDGDFVSALDATGPVVIDLVNPSSSSPDYQGDTYANLEGIIGVAGFANTITGDNQGWQIAGGDVDDVLTGGGGRDLLVGLAGNDELFGGGNADTFFGDDGDDRHTGGGGPDVFLFVDDGQDVITDFEVPAAGAGFIDRAIFTGAGLSFADLAFSTDTNGDAVISYASSSVTFEGVTEAALNPTPGTAPDWLLVFP